MPLSEFTGRPVGGPSWSDPSIPQPTRVNFLIRNVGEDRPRVLQSDVASCSLQLQLAGGWPRWMKRPVTVTSSSRCAACCMGRLMVVRHQLVSRAVAGTP